MNECNFNGKIRYFSTRDVAEQLNENDSTIRFWCINFDKDILNIETQGYHRKFKNEDIEKLKYIKKLLRENGYTIKQVKEYYRKENINRTKSEDSNSMLLNELVSKFSIETKENLDNIKKEIEISLKAEIQRLIDNQNKNNSELKEFIGSTIKKTLNDKLNELKVFEQLKIEQAKNKQLTDLILRLNEKPNNENITSKKKLLKRNIFDIHR